MSFKTQIRKFYNLETWTRITRYAKGSTQNCHFQPLIYMFRMHQSAGFYVLIFFYFLTSHSHSVPHSALGLLKFYFGLLKKNKGNTLNRTQTVLLEGEAWGYIPVMSGVLQWSYWTISVSILHQWQYSINCPFTCRWYDCLPDNKI